MDRDTAVELEVLSDEELAQVVGGTDLSKLDTRELLLSKVGMCGCGLSH